MTVQKRRTARNVNVELQYGIAPTLAQRFLREEIAGLSAGDIIARMIAGPHAPGSATRTAKVLADVMATQRAIDVELVNASSGAVDGEPIRLDQVIVTKEEGGEERHESPVIQETEEITIRLSESYVGGRR